MYIQQCCCWAISPGIYPLDDGEFIHNGQLTSEDLRLQGPTGLLIWYTLDLFLKVKLFAFASATYITNNITYGIKFVE